MTVKPCIGRLQQTYFISSSYVTIMISPESTCVQLSGGARHHNFCSEPFRYRSAMPRSCEHLCRLIRSLATPLWDKYPVCIWALRWQNLSSGFLKKWDSNQTSQLQRPHRKCLVASLDILSRTPITKVLIRAQAICAGWSAYLLLTTPRRWVFSWWGPYKSNAATISPPVRRHLNGVSLLGQYRPENVCWLGKFCAGSCFG